MRPIRILRVVARLNIGGPAIHVTLLSHTLSEPKYKSLLVAGKIEEGEGDMSYLADSFNVERRIISDLGRSVDLKGDLRSLWQMWKIMRDFKPDVVHTHTAKAGFIGRLVAWVARVPVSVHTFHGHVLSGYFGPLKTRVFLALEQIAARMCDRVLTLTPSLKNELAHKFHVCPEDKIQVLSLGLDLERFYRKPRKAGEFLEAWGLSQEHSVIGIVGRMVPIKNHKLFAEAAAIVAKEKPEARFVVIGDGETRQEFTQQIEDLGLSEKFVLTGWHNQLELVYSDLDVLVLCSNNEGTPVSIIESLTSGCPVLSTDVGGVSELLRNGELGKLVPPKDPLALAEGILAILEGDSPDVDRLEIREAYGIERLTEDLDKLYLDLLEEKGALPAGHRQVIGPKL